ncbi:hypothetical protein [Nocardioides ochotonae]|uniref:hypothetical protein n=1 Tax=Nocardioides ochotonae TaxID=2685869 RepID=UPI00140BACC8|nr:hypothetical protein [Nocardioides ochotonae]
MTPNSSDPTWERTARAVRDAAPDVPELTAEEKAALWARVEAHQPAVGRRRRGWKVVVAGVVAAALVGGAGAATAEVLSARTGEFPADAEAIELGGPGEYLDPEAPDFSDVLDEVSADIDFPSAESRDRALGWELTNYSDGSGATVSTGAIRLWMAGHALCSWTDTWAAALRTGDTATQHEAAQVVLDARTWPAITDTDPDLANESEFDWLPELERAIEAADPAAARRALDPHQACMPGLAPELGMGEPQ